MSVEIASRRSGKEQVIQEFKEWVSSRVAEIAKDAVVPALYPASLKELVEHAQRMFELGLRRVGREMGADIVVEAFYHPGVSVSCELIGRKELGGGDRVDAMWCKLNADGNIVFRTGDIPFKGMNLAILRGIARVKWAGEGVCIKTRSGTDEILKEEHENEAPIDECLITRIDAFSITAESTPEDIRLYGEK
ncbi:MAG: hypothetical protein JHC33_13845 [Ignisphaera sp.]|nr:hypothetical protein [Ignisphaera sp.]